MIQSLEEFETASHPVKAEGCKEAPAELEVPGSASSSMMAMRLATPGLQFDIRTALDTSSQLVALTARLELTSEMLQDTMRRLEAAHMRIGQLESELGSKRENNLDKRLERELEKDHDRDQEKDRESDQDRVLEETIDSAIDKPQNSAVCATESESE